MYVCVIAGILSTEVNSIRLPKILAISHTKYVFWLNLLCSCYRWQWTTPHGDPAVLQLEGSIFSFPVLYVSLDECWFIASFISYQLVTNQHAYKVTNFPAHTGKTRKIVRRWRRHTIGCCGPLLGVNFLKASK